jgi:hypothetical protein
VTKDEKYDLMREALDSALDHAARTLNADYDGYRWFGGVETTDFGLVVLCHFEPPETWNKIKTRCGLEVEWKVKPEELP